MTAKIARGAAIFAALGLLSGCAMIDPVPECPGPDPCVDLIVQIVPPLSVVLDARRMGGAEYDWYLAGGAYGNEGWSVLGHGGILQHTFPEPGTYSVVVYAHGNGANGGGGNTDGPNIGTGGGDAVPGEDGVTSGYGIVKVGEQSGPKAVIVAWRGNKPTTSYYAWDAPTFWGGSSQFDGNDGLWYQWQAERRYRPRVWEGGEWVVKPWTPWHVPVGREDTHRYQGETWNADHNLFRVPGSDKTQQPLSEMQYRITLTVTDAFGRQDTTSLIVTVYTGCP